MSENVVELAKTLINIESVTGNEGPMADWLQAYLEPKGWTVIRQEYAPGRDNVFAHRGNANPKLVFNSHIDTVPPFFPMTMDEEWIYGRGACDTKSLIAAQLLAAQSLIDDGRDDIGLLYVVGEEVDHCGMVKANELGLNPDYLIVGEPTESKLVKRQKGIVKLRLEGKGKAAHSGYPETGVSAIDPLIDALADIRKASWPADVNLGETTINIGVIGGGRAANVVPDQSFAEVMVRVVTNAAEIESKVREIVGDRVEVKLVTSNDPTDLSVLDGYETTIVAFNTDIPYLKFDGKALLWGAGTILDAHTAGEKIRIEDLKAAVGVYRELALRCLKG